MRFNIFFIIYIAFYSMSLMGKESTLYGPFNFELIERIERINDKQEKIKKEILTEMVKANWIDPSNNFLTIGDFDVDQMNRVIIGTISDRNTSVKSVNINGLTDCRFVKLGYKSSIYFFNRIKDISNKLLDILQKKKSDLTPDSKKEEKLLENELQNVTKLLKEAYPKSFGEIDRILTYEWDFPILEKASDLNAINVERIDVDQINIFNSPIDTSNNHKFLSLPFERPYYHNGKIIVEFSLTPTEACLQNLSLQMKGNLYLNNYNKNHFDWDDRVIITGGDLPMPPYIHPEDIINPWEGLPIVPDNNNWCGTAPRPLPLPSNPGYFPFPGFGGGGSRGGFPGFFGTAFGVRMASLPTSMTSTKRSAKSNKLQEWKLYLRAYIDMNAE